MPNYKLAEKGKKIKQKERICEILPKCKEEESAKSPQTNASDNIGGNKGKKGERPRNYREIKENTATEKKQSVMMRRETCQKEKREKSWIYK